VVEHKNTELDEKNALIKSYLTKVVGVFASLLSYTSLPVRFNSQTPVAVVSVLSLCAAAAHETLLLFLRLECTCSCYAKNCNNCHLLSFSSVL
jgi:hypothetical protein